MKKKRKQSKQDGSVIFCEFSSHNLCTRSICGLLLADYYSSQAVAPIGDAFAQALGALIQFADEDTVEKVCSSILQLEKKSDWEHKHSGFVGLKFFLAVRNNLVPGFIQQRISVEMFMKWMFG